MLTDDQTDRLRAAFAEHCRDGSPFGSELEELIARSTGLPRRAVELFALERGIVPERYSRNIGTVGLDGQRKLLTSRVLVVGLGGLGGHVAETLARLGVGHIVAVDGDAFVESNLNRQLLCETASIGKPKVDEARLRVARVNPAVCFDGHACPFGDLPAEVFEASDLVFDCLDGIPARRELAERCSAAGVVLVHGAIAGWAGQVGLCRPGTGMLARIYSGAERGQEGRLGNLPFTAAVAANLMAAKAAAILLGLEPAAGRQLLFFDLLGGDWESIEV